MFFKVDEGLKIRINRVPEGRHPKKDLIGSDFGKAKQKFTNIIEVSQAVKTVSALMSQKVF